MLTSESQKAVPSCLATHRYICALNLSSWTLRVRCCAKTLMLALRSLMGSRRSSWRRTNIYSTWHRQCSVSTQTGPLTSFTKNMVKIICIWRANTASLMWSRHFFTTALMWICRRTTSVGLTEVWGEPRYNESLQWVASAQSFLRGRRWSSYVDTWGTRPVRARWTRWMRKGSRPSTSQAGRVLRSLSRPSSSTASST